MDNKTTPPHWKSPATVMRMYKHRMRQKNLQSQFVNQENNKSSSKAESSEKEKKFANRNPFKRAKIDTDAKFNADLNDDTTTDGTLFRLLNFSQQNSNPAGDESANTSFANVLATLNNCSSQKEGEAPDPSTSEDVLIDWTLRWRVRLMSSQSFPWNRKLKTCEEASGITGFVRCIDTNSQNNEISLDTSPNARFHQCCLVWQHPYIPWLDLYPRTSRRSAGSSDLSVLPVKDALYNAWVDSFRSLFQLVRAKQCPYFYLVTNSFICLFRAAGINGYTEMNASITPTSRGFRQLLKEEDIDFTMPLKSNDKTKSPLTSDSQDTGYDSLDTAESYCDKNTNEADDDDTDEWLQTMGIEESQIKQINAKQFDIALGKDKITDSLPESLVFVEGVEAQALFNYLMNCKSIIPTTGPLAGVPPTLLSPVAFTGASLVPLKVKESIIRMQDHNYHSIEIRGPMLPHMIHNLCDLMKNSSLEKFSLTFADIESSKPFTAMTACHMAGATDPKSPVKTPRTPSVFGEQNLSDCGLKPKVLARFCSNKVRQFDSIQFSNNVYTCK